jgi:hypothetical protein
MKKYVYIIDTTEYAGNFEREMCAYITGMTGDCGVGREFAEMYSQDTGEDESKFYEFVEQRADDNGCMRPCSIHPTPGWFNHGMGEHFKIGEDAKALKDYVKVVTSESKENIKNLEGTKAKLLRGEKYANWTVAACDREIKENKKEIEKVMKLKKPSHFAAYLSVAIYFHKKPTQELTDLMKRRALNFAATKRKYAKDNDISYELNFALNITGFRLIEETLKQEEVEV